MWWITLIASVALVVMLVILAARTSSAARRRAAGWNDLHQRGKLIASQLARLNEAAGRGARAGTEEVAACPAELQRQSFKDSSRRPKNSAGLPADLSKVAVPSIRGI